MRDYLVAATLVVAMGAMLLGVPAATRPFPAVQRHARSITHFLSAVLTSIGVYAVESRWLILAVGALAIPSLVAAIELGLLGSMLTGSRIRDYGFVAYGIGFVLAVALFMPDRRAIAAALLTLGVADPLASIVGGRFGRHRVATWRSVRTVEGGLAFAVAAFLVGFVAFAASGSLDRTTVSAAVFIAATSAAVEMLLPSALDNLGIPLWAGLLYFLVGRHAHAPGVDWFVAVAVSAPGAMVVARLRWLDGAAAIAAFVSAATSLALGGWDWLLPILAFLVTGSVLTKLHATDAERRPRSLEQTAVNGIVPLLPVIGYALTKDSAWYVLYVGAVAVANADTWATEIGRLFGGAPVSLRTFRRTEKGASGAVTLVGTAASLAGGGLVGAIAAAVNSTSSDLVLVAVGAVIGPLGMALDSALGAWAQCRYRCSSCDAWHERPLHCGTASPVVAGLRGLTNERVNLVSNFAGALLALELSVVVGR